MINATGLYYTPGVPISDLGNYMPYQGLWRDWLTAYWAGALALFFGALWLYKDMILFSFIAMLVFLPTWSASLVYVTYN